MARKKDDEWCDSDELDVYSEDCAEELVESDVLDGAEEGFMKGYLDSVEE